MKPIATVTIYFDPRGLSEDKFSVKWYIYHEGKQKMFATGKTVSAAEMKFLKQYAGGLRGTVKDEEKRQLWNEIYVTLLSQAQNIIKELGDNFSFQLFKEHLKGKNEANQNNKGSNSVMDAYNHRIQALIKKSKHNSANLHENAYNSISRFVNEVKKYGSIKDLKFSNIPIDFFREYEDWMKVNGKKAKSKPASAASSSTIRFYITSFLLLHKQARIHNDTKFLYNPEGKEKYSPPKSHNIKKALTKEDIGRLFNYQPEYLSTEQRSIDLFLFSYLCNGMNFTDILRISNESVKDNKIVFIRQKTKETIKSGAKDIIIHISPQIRAIIERWKNNDPNPGRSIWVFSKNIDLNDKTKLFNHIRNITLITNRDLKKVAKKLNLPPGMSTYYARHSFATILMRSSVPIAFISQSLGHASILTTQNYLSTFEDDQTQDFLANLLPDPKASE